MEALQPLIDAIADAVAKRLQRQNEGPVVLNTGEAAELMRTSPGYVRQLIASGELPAVKRGRVLRVLKTDVIALLERKRG